MIISVGLVGSRSDHRFEIFFCKWSLANGSGLLPNNGIQMVLQTIRKLVFFLFRSKLFRILSKKVVCQSNRLKRTIHMGILLEITGISMSKIIEPRMSLAFKKKLVKIIYFHSNTFSEKMP